MQFASKFFRFLLNINTVWGLMILVAFALCVIQHYLPTTTAIDGSLLREGENALTIRITDRKGKTQDYPFTMTLGGGQPTLNVGDAKPQPDKPWLISARRVRDAVLLTWDYPANAKYQLAVDDKVVKKGLLVTLQSLTDASFDYAQTGFDIALGLIASMVLFLGLMKVGEEAGIVQIVARLFHPVIRFLFPDIPKDHPAAGAILMNWTTTLLGLGNASTPFGLKAMKELQSLNPHPEVASNSQVMLLGYNTAGLALLPTTLLALRKSAGCSDPFEIIGPCMVAGTIATVTAIIMVKLLGVLPMFSVQASLTEPAATPAGSKEGQ